MIRTVGIRRADALAFGPLLAAIAVVGTFVAAVALPELIRVAGGPAPAASPSASPEPTSPMALSPINIAMPPDADCRACHVESSGGVGTRPIPALAHPLEGWTDCTACHANDRLVATAPGHSSLHKTDCLTCHKLPDAAASAPPRPHHVVTGQTCESCHGIGPRATAPLPTDMAGRTNCWLCHTSGEYDDLFDDATGPATGGDAASDGPSWPIHVSPSPTGP